MMALFVDEYMHHFALMSKIMLERAKIGSVGNGHAKRWDVKMKIKQTENLDGNICQQVLSI